MPDPHTWSYTGPVYIRPVGRGVVFEAAGVDGEYVDDVLARLLADRESYGRDQRVYARVRIEVERLEAPP